MTLIVCFTENVIIYISTFTVWSHEYDFIIGALCTYN